MTDCIGHFVQEWWDTCPQAGPKTRPSAGFSASEPSLALLTTVKLKGSILSFNVVVVHVSARY